MFAGVAGAAAAERLTVRLALTLERMRTRPLTAGTSLTARLGELFTEPAPAPPEVIAVEAPAWRGRDSLALGLACLLVVATWLPAWR